MSPLQQLLFWIAVILPLHKLMLPLDDPDPLWHVRAGQWIWQHGSVPRRDPFSWTMADQPWVAHEWLFEVIVYPIYRSMHLFGLLLLVFSVAALTLWAWDLWAKQIGARDGVRGIALLLAVDATSVFWAIRPQIFSYLFVFVTLAVIAAARRRPQRAWWLPPLFLLWANLHASFAVGPALLIGEIILGPGGWHAFRHRWRHASGPLIAGLMATLANPQGWRLWLFAWQVTQNGTLHGFINEWKPLAPTGPLAWTLAGLLLGALLLLWQRLPLANWQERVYLLGLGVATWSAVRYAPYLMLYAAGVLARLGSIEPLPWVGLARRLEGLRPVPPWFPSAVRWSRPLLVIAVALVLWVPGPRGWTLETDSVSAIYPAGAIDYLRQHPVVRLWNDYNYGGALIASLPGQPVSIDGRADLYFGRVLNDYIDIASLTRDPLPLLQSYRAGAVLTASGGQLAWYLRQSGRWQVVYSDSEATLFLPK